MLFHQHIIQTRLQGQGNSMQGYQQEPATMTKASESILAHFDWDDCCVAILNRFPSVAC